MGNSRLPRNRMFNKRYVGRWEVLCPMLRCRLLSYLIFIKINALAKFKYNNFLLSISKVNNFFHPFADYNLLNLLQTWINNWNIISSEIRIRKPKSKHHFPTLFFVLSIKFCAVSIGPTLIKARRKFLHEKQVEYINWLDAISIFSPLVRQILLERHIEKNTFPDYLHGSRCKDLFYTRMLVYYLLLQIVLKWS